MSRLYSWLTGPVHHRTGLRTFHIAIGMIAVFRAVTEGRHMFYFWGPNGLGEYVEDTWPTGLSLFSNALFSTSTGTVAVVVLLFVGGLCLLANRWTYAACVLLYLSFLLIEMRLPDARDAGDNVARITLFYTIFMVHGERDDPPSGSLRAWIHNLAVAAVFLQVMVIYANAGLYKVRGEMWFNGTAMYYISQVAWFSNTLFRHAFTTAFSTTVATYGTVLYQVFFPVAILGPLKLPWLALGILLHAAIFLMMGLVTFSTVMIGLELFLVSDGEFAMIRAWIRGRTWLGRQRHPATTSA